VPREQKVLLYIVLTCCCLGICSIFVWPLVMMKQRQFFAGHSEVLDRMKKDAKKSHGGHYELGDAAGADIPMPPDVIDTAPPQPPGTPGALTGAEPHTWRGRRAQLRKHTFEEEMARLADLERGDEYASDEYALQATSGFARSQTSSLSAGRASGRSLRPQSAPAVGRAGHVAAGLPGQLPLALPDSSQDDTFLDDTARRAPRRQFVTTSHVDQYTRLQYAAAAREQSQRRIATAFAPMSMSRAQIPKTSQGFERPLEDQLTRVAEGSHYAFDPQDELRTIRAKHNKKRQSIYD